MSKPGSGSAARIQVDYQFKVVLVGNSGAGKTNLVSRYTKGRFDDRSTATVGAEIATKVLRIRGLAVKGSIWDTAGQERYMAMTKRYYRGILGALVVFDITSDVSFQRCNVWLDELRVNCEGTGVVIVLVGNKADLGDSRAVSKAAAEQFAEEQGIMYYETSALSGSNVNAAFDGLFDRIVTVHHDGNGDGQGNGSGGGAGLAHGIAPAGGGAAAGTVTLDGNASGRKQKGSCC